MHNTIILTVSPHCALTLTTAAHLAKSNQHRRHAAAQKGAKRIRDCHERAVETQAEMIAHIQIPDSPRGKDCGSLQYVFALIVPVTLLFDTCPELQCRIRVT